MGTGSKTKYTDIAEYMYMYVQYMYPHIEYIHTVCCLYVQYMYPHIEYIRTVCCLYVHCTLYMLCYLSMFTSCFCCGFSLHVVPLRVVYLLWLFTVFVCTIH